MEFPSGKKFIFTIFDDTDLATVENVGPVYDLLNEVGIRTTKSVWVYPSRGTAGGQCLLDDDYLKFVLSLQDKGFELALHNVGDGVFNRQEILAGIDLYKKLTGRAPIIHTNHISNPDHIYWFDERFEWPISVLYSAIYRLRRGPRVPSGGNDPTSNYFWGDVAKTKIKYIRNLVFNDINTLASDPKMPYRCDRKGLYSNYWFSSSDGLSLREMNQLLSQENCDRLESEGGVCIAYTHFAYRFVEKDGKLNPDFEKRIRYLAAKPGWFVPVSTVLDYLLANNSGGDDPGYVYRLTRNLAWFADRVMKRMRRIG